MTAVAGRRMGLSDMDNFLYQPLKMDLMKAPIEQRSVPSEH